jgi:hypothetical protein
LIRLQCISLITPIFIFCIYLKGMDQYNRTKKVKNDFAKNGIDIIWIDYLPMILRCGPCSTLFAKGAESPVKMIKFA